MNPLKTVTDKRVSRNQAELSFEGNKITVKTVSRSYDHARAPALKLHAHTTEQLLYHAVHAHFCTRTHTYAHAHAYSLERTQSLLQRKERRKFKWSKVCTYCILLSSAPFSSVSSLISSLLSSLPSLSSLLSHSLHSLASPPPLLPECRQNARD